MILVRRFFKIASLSKVLIIKELIIDVDIVIIGN